jgi:hypothetical protein
MAHRPFFGRERKQGRRKRRRELAAGESAVGTEGTIVLLSTRRVDRCSGHGEPPL